MSDAAIRKLEQEIADRVVAAIERVVTEQALNTPLNRDALISVVRAAAASHRHEWHRQVRGAATSDGYTVIEETVCDCGAKRNESLDMEDWPVVTDSLDVEDWPTR